MRLDRLFSITMMLLNHKRISATDLAARFEVSLRTIYRDMETINRAGIPVVSFSGSDGGYEIMQSYRLDRQYLSLEDLYSIYSALRGMQSATGDTGMAELLDRVGALISDKLHDLDTSGMLLDFASASGPKEHLRTLHLAIKELRLVQLDYMDIHGVETQRMVEPMGLYLKSNAWYLWGYCRVRCALRVFRLSRMNRVRMMSETFSRRGLSIEDVDADRVQSGAAPCVCVRLRFQAAVKTRVRDEFLPDQLKSGPDGTILANACYYTKESAIRHLMSYGTNVTLLAPSELVDDFRRHIAEIAKMYS
ncbi:helix-turn-helix transcriptional regulator [Paenibacillus oleatilyticus]|uniref:helix-turn-helix transcriptional regulator n=1 Tax=Paenibacillus oleatilyticus TaxID=2594886 RepID=UPI001C1F832A|nr:YafY family protein [Paenibacillus oleatilyticus]MBU7314935.1 YafY family transcriptional regulator [Paenibacillus oleatilyticus]